MKYINKIACMIIIITISLIFISTKTNHSTSKNEQFVHETCKENHNIINFTDNDFVDQESTKEFISNEEFIEDYD